MNEIDSKVSYTYVYPLYPKKYDNVDVSIRINESIKQVKLFVLLNGCYDEIHPSYQKDNRVTLSFNMKNNKEAYYYFVLKTEDSYLYYSTLGKTSYYPSKKDMFRIVSDIKAPTWVGGSTCYQIFPDRFKNGNKDLDVKDNEYCFDNGCVKALSFKDKPLNFEQGRCLDFFNGDLYGVIDSIDHLKRLNITSIYLNPIAVSMTTHRYDCCDFFHIDPKLGSDEAFIKLVDKMHENNIKVIVDISINHTGTNHPWFIKAKSDKNSEESKYYYIKEDGSVACWFDVPTLPQLNYNSSKLRDLMYRNKDSVMQKFLRPPFNQDGWRLDVASVVGKRDNDDFCQEIWREVNTNLKAIKDDIYLVGEEWHEASTYLEGDQWDATMNYNGCGRIIRRFLGEQDRFTCLNWGQNPTKITPYNCLDVKNSLVSHLNSILGQMSYFQMNLIDSHDTPRLHNHESVMDFSLYSGGVMLQYLLPGMPSLYYGDEVGLDGQIDSVEMWRYPMNWDEKTWNKDFFNLYTLVGQIRSEYNDILKYGSTDFLETDADTMTFIRYKENEALVLLLNRSENRTFTFDLDKFDISFVKNLTGKNKVKFKDNKISVELKNKESVILYVK